MTEQENIRYRLAEVGRRLDDLREDMDEKHLAVMGELTKVSAANAELLALFNGGKAALGFIRGAGKITITFSVFVAALGAIWLSFKAFLAVLFAVPK